MMRIVIMLPSLSRVAIPARSSDFDILIHDGAIDDYVLAFIERGAAACIAHETEPKATCGCSFIAQAIAASAVALSFAQRDVACFWAREAGAFDDGTPRISAPMREAHICQPYSRVLH